MNPKPKSKFKQTEISLPAHKVQACSTVHEMQIGMLSKVLDIKIINYYTIN